MSGDDLQAVITRLERLPTDVWDPPTPPPLKVLRAPRPRRRLTLRPALAAAYAGSLLAVGVAAGALLTGGGDEPAQRLALEPLGGDGARGSAALLTGRPGRVTLTVSGLESPADGSFYELWLLGPGDELVSLGSFPVDGDGSATVTVPLPVDPAAFRFFDVSREPADGDPGHSGASVLRGPTA